MATYKQGAGWFDVLRYHIPPIILSRRVVDVIREDAFSDLSVARIEFQTLPKKLRDEPQPEYFAVQPSLGMIFKPTEADIAAATSVCMQCGQWTIDPSHPASKLQPFRTAVPIEGTWSGKHFFSRRIDGMYLCTRQFVETARRRGWTNWRFDAFDDVHEHKFNWNGIDYLGPKWPPEHWYAPTPDHGKTKEEWLAALVGNDANQAFGAQAALAYIGSPVIKDLILILRGTDVRAAYQAAVTLRKMALRTALPNDLLQEAVDVVGKAIKSDALRWD